LKKIARIILYVVGIIASVLAAYGLVALGFILPMLGKWQYSYLVNFSLLLLSIGCVAFFIRAWLGRLSEIEKWTGVMILLGCAAYMMSFRGIRIIIEIVALFFTASGCLMFAKAREGSKEFPTWGKVMLATVYSVLFLIFSAAIPDRETGRNNQQPRSPETQAERNTGADTANISDDDIVRDLGFRWVLPPDYYQGTFFHKGRAWVQEKKDGPWTLFDTEGNVIKKDFVAKDVSHGRDRDTRFEAIEKDSETGWKMYGILDFSGDIVAAPKPYRSSPLFQEGLSYLKAENGLYGVIDYQGNWVIHPSYENFKPLDEGLWAVKKNGKWGYINKKGEVVIDFQFENAYGFNNGLAVVSQNSPDGPYGLIDRDGNWVTEAIYELFIYPFSHLIAAQKNGKIGYLDEKGNVVIDFKFEGIERRIVGGIASGRASVFYDGLALVTISKEEKNGNTVYKRVGINESGDIITPEQDGFMYSGNRNRFLL